MRTLYTLETEKALLTQRLVMSGFAQAFTIQKKLDKVNAQIAALKLAQESKENKTSTTD